MNKIIYFSVSLFLLTSLLSCGDSNINPKAFYKIVSLYSGKTLEAVNNSRDNGAMVVQDLEKKSNSQLWRMVPDKLGFYMIINEGSGKCLDTSTGSLTQWDINNTDNQKWVLLKSTNNAYTIISKSQNKCLDVRGGSLNNGAEVIIYNTSGSGGNQWWKIVKAK